MSLSNLPGRRIAGSIMSGRLLAPITTTLTKDSMPSISVSNWLITRSDAPLSPRSDPLLGATESSSSKKTIDGAALRPFLKTSRIPLSDSPTHFSTSSGRVMERKVAPQGLHRSLSAECRYVRAGVAVANVRQPMKIHIQGQWHRSRVNLQNLMSARFVGDSDLYFPVEAPRASERRVDGVRPIRSAYHDDVSPGGHAIHEGEQLSHNSTFHFSRHFLSLWSDGVHLVDEYDTGRALLSFLKNLPQPGL